MDRPGNAEGRRFGWRAAHSSQTTVFIRERRSGSDSVGVRLKHSLVGLPDLLNIARLLRKVNELLPPVGVDRLFT